MIRMLEISIIFSLKIDYNQLWFLLQKFCFKKRKKFSELNWLETWRYLAHWLDKVLKGTYVNRACPSWNGLLKLQTVPLKDWICFSIWNRRRSCKVFGEEMWTSDLPGWFQIRDSFNSILSSGLLPGSSLYSRGTQSGHSVSGAGQTGLREISTS